MNADLISAFVLLFLVLDPLGNLPVVASLLKQVDSTRRARVVIRECFIAYFILLAFMFGGRQFLGYPGTDHRCFVEHYERKIFVVCP